MDYAALKTEIQSGPLAAELAPFVADGSDSKVAEILNRADISAAVTTRLDIAAVLSKLGVTNGTAFLEGLEAVAASASTAAPVVKWTLLVLKSGGEINVGDPQSQAFLPQLQGAGVPHATDVAALALRNISRSEQLFGLGTKVTDVDVRHVLWNDDGSKAL